MKRPGTKPSAGMAEAHFATWHRQAGSPTNELQRLGDRKTTAMVERYWGEKVVEAEEILIGQNVKGSLCSFGRLSFTSPHPQMLAPCRRWLPSSIGPDHDCDAGGVDLGSRE